MSGLAAVKIVVSGVVQGVFFRDFIATHAHGLGIAGYARNLPGGAVEVVAEGRKDNLKRLIDHIRTGPPQAVVERVDVVWMDYSGGYADFKIRY